MAVYKGTFDFNDFNNAADIWALFSNLNVPPDAVLGNVRVNITTPFACDVYNNITLGAGDPSNREKFLVAYDATTAQPTETDGLAWPDISFTESDTDSTPLTFGLFGDFTPPLTAGAFKWSAQMDDDIRVWDAGTSTWVAA